jgi:hypothetical protein
VPSKSLLIAKPFLALLVEPGRILGLVCEYRISAEYVSANCHHCRLHYCAVRILSVLDLRSRKAAC